jgi:hypothetical protein
MHTKRILSLASGSVLALAAMSYSRPSQADIGLHADLDKKSGGEIGLYLGITPGIVGDLQNPSVVISPGLTLTVGSAVRYHLTLGYSYLEGSHGIDIQPLTIGVPIHVTSTRDVGFAIEPTLSILGGELYFGESGPSFLFESGIGLQAIVNFESVYIAASPLNLQVRYLMIGDILPGAPTFGVGLNLPFRLAAGLRF